ncbi:MAG: hypothetical protein A2X05_00115 [Bacteroidetes bacterium GWE2_41_25]|nr:MAG: hypothetical protein A2X03_04360 [Bacteroidetes bacterium GWA2_40_15]OFX89344.1 MAG: hypothetical protein A2X06_07585 [Bacteroidetes bacterium GWC2_40_22]OFY03233.1 MAG: hypothetical protein A2X05_00115 [Bacteroidetes bacterium GWE2_41_25]OFY58172.1 MAG: hypothetical protein A2X04_00800 [Bacteroidetes bacterium GWF2_41_9]HBH84489.1 nuclear pore complex subunit [Bacteroidales bacterium]
MVYPEKYIKEISKRTPWIILEPGKLFIMGRSIPENPGDFYRPLQAWITDYTQKYRGSTKIILGFEYINTASMKWIYTILREMSQVKEFARDATITWYYEEGDEDMKDLGLILKSLVVSTFTMIEVEEMDKGRYEMVLAARK